MKGFTLAEVLVALSVSVLVGAVLVGIMINSTGLFYKQSSKVTQGLNVNDSLAKIRSSVKQARNVAASYQDGSTTYTSGTSQIVLRLLSVDALGNVISNTFDHAVYFTEVDRLRIKVFPNALSTRPAEDQILSFNVNNLVFQYFDGAGSEVTPPSAIKVRISLTLKEKAGYGFEIQTATSEANLRND